MILRIDRLQTALRLRQAAGPAKVPSGVVAQNTHGSGNGNGVMNKVKDKIG